MNQKSSFESILDSMPEEIRNQVKGPLNDVFRTGSVDSTLTALYIVKDQIDMLIKKIEEKQREHNKKDD